MFVATIFWSRFSFSSAWILLWSLTGPQNLFAATEWSLTISWWCAEKSEDEQKRSPVDFIDHHLSIFCRLDLIVDVFFFMSFRVILSPPEMFESSCTGSLSPCCILKMWTERAKMSFMSVQRFEATEAKEDYHGHRHGDPNRVLCCECRVYIYI